jgi:hypothetical protein
MFAQCGTNATVTTQQQQRKAQTKREKKAKATELKGAVAEPGNEEGEQSATQKILKVECLSVSEGLSRCQRSKKAFRIETGLT